MLLVLALPLSVLLAPSLLHQKNRNEGIMRGERKKEGKQAGTYIMPKIPFMILPLRTTKTIQ